MFLSILTALKAFGTFVSKLLAGAMSWAAANPKTAIIGLALVATHAGTAWYAYTSATDKTTIKFQQQIGVLAAKVEKYEKDIRDRNVKIEEVEASSKEAAKEAKAEIAKKEKQLDKATSDFKIALAKEIAKRKAGTGGGSTVSVTSPETNNPVDVTLDKDEVICSRFHDAFLTSINSMVTISNTPISEKPSKTVPNTALVENVVSTTSDSTVAAHKSQFSGKAHAFVDPSFSPKEEIILEQAAFQVTNNYQEN